MRLLRRLAKNERTTVVIVSHDDRLREVADRVLWLEDGVLRSLQALVRDPVCGMLIDPARAGASLERDGELVLFCSRGCRDEFLHDRDTHEGYTSVITERENVR
jgi:putative ABC transport system ATP-binding protein